MPLFRIWCHGSLWHPVVLLAVPHEPGRRSTALAGSLVGLPAHGHVRQLCGSSSRRPPLALVDLASNPGGLPIVCLLAPASAVLLRNSHAPSSHAAVPRAGACAAHGRFGEGVVSRHPGAGRSPADKGHGWPASSPAVGPAPMLSHGAYIIFSADWLFFACAVQKLPSVNLGVNLHHAKGKMS